MVFLIQKTLIYAIPLLIVALAGMFAERSGIINIALDGIMILGSFIGALFVYLMQMNNVFADQPQTMFILAMLIAAVAGALFSLLLSFSAIKLKADQTIGGTALNLLAPAVALFIIKVFFMQDKLVMPKDIGFVILNNDLPLFAKIFFDKAYVSTFIAIALFVILSILIYKTKYGLRLRSCGEHPQAADSVGINVYKMRYLGTTISGALAGMGGYIYIATVAGGTCDGAVAGNFLVTAHQEHQGSTVASVQRLLLCLCLGALHDEYFLRLIILCGGRKLSCAQNFCKYLLGHGIGQIRAHRIPLCTKRHKIHEKPPCICFFGFSIAQFSFVVKIFSLYRR